MDRLRDYSHEQKLRNKRKIRFAFELDISKGNELREYLKNNNITLTNWIKNQIKEMEI
jgi:hypothetical protein